MQPPQNFDLNVYLNSMFRMYTGPRKQIELVCSNDVMDAIIDMCPPVLLQRVI